MACETINLKEVERKRRDRELKELSKKLLSGEAGIVIDPVTGAMAIKGWSASNIGMVDGCVINRLKVNFDPGLAKAIAKAEMVAGRKANYAANSAGHHSHDGGKTWDKH